MKIVKKYLVFILGLFIFSTGISFGNKSLLGGNPMSILVVGLSKHIPFSIGTCNLIVGIVEIIIGFILDKKNITLATFIGLICGSYSIDIANMFIPDTSVLGIRIIYMYVGIICYCLGLSLQHKAACGYGNLDCFNFGIKKALNLKDYHTARWISDAIFVVSGFLLGGIVNVGTALLLCFAGLIIEFFKKILDKLFND